MVLKKTLFVLFLCKMMLLSAQSLQHPIIYTKANERPKILKLIKDYDWAKSIKLQLHVWVDSKLKIHQENPYKILKDIPAFANNSGQNSESEASPYAHKHNALLSLASKSAMLYYLTQEEKYAQFSADILAPYINELSNRTIKTTTICGNEFYDPRTTYAPLAITYDFIHPYLVSKKATVFDKNSGKRIAFDNDKAQKAFTNIVGDVLQEYGKTDIHGCRVTNHPILTAPGALFAILCIENDAERERLFDIFWEKGTKHQNSFKNTILPMFGEQGIWPESLSYSFMSPLTMILNIVDRLKPEMNVSENYKNIFEGNFLFDNLRNPDRTFVRYGDSKRNNDKTQDLYRFTLNMAERKGYTALKNKAQIALKQAYNSDGGYSPLLTDNIFNNFEELQLFWGNPIPDTLEGKIDFQKPTVIIKHAGLALQRNYVEKDNENYGLTGIIGGAHYVHSHVTGIAMELYGAGYVMGPNGGLAKTVAKRKIPEHTNYFRLYAGNNTVIVNGTSHGIQKDAWNRNSYLWQNTTVNVAAEPKHLEEPISKNFSFATQFLDDKVNNAYQQRTLSIIRTSETTAYYFDMFRSKSLGENKFHDYIYHNIGDNIQILANNNELEVKETDKYKTHIGDPVESPGWKLFEETKSTKPNDEAVTVRFNINYDNKQMYLFTSKGIKREFTKALGPATREAKNGYVDKKTQIIAIRQKGEAWKRPYVQVFEPTIADKSSVKSVENLYRDDVTVGLKVISNIDGKEIIDYVICQEDASKTFNLPEVTLSFNGRFGIVRLEKMESKTQLTLYIGEGEKLIFGKHVLEVDSDKKGQLITELK